MSNAKNAEIKIKKKLNANEIWSDVKGATKWTQDERRALAFQVIRVHLK